MAGTKGSALTALTGANLAVGDLLLPVDISDTTMGAGGTNKKMTAAEFLAGLAAISASAPLGSGLTLNNGTLTASQPVLDLSQTWNAVGTTFTGLKFNVTDTASAAASLLLNLQVGGTSILQVGKSFDSLTAAVLTVGASFIYTEASGGTRGIRLLGPGGGGIVIGATSISNTDGSTVSLSSNGIGVRSGNYSIGFVGGTDATDVKDVTLYRDAANTLALRNGASAQAFNVYNNTDGTNKEYGFMRFASNVLEIGTAAAGTGSTRNVSFMYGSTARFLLVASGIRVDAAMFPPAGAGTDLGSASANQGFRNIIGQQGYHEMNEMTAPAAPATNAVRIYAVDNGAGKTQLMALFATGVAQQIAIEP